MKLMFFVFVLLGTLSALAGEINILPNQVSFNVNKDVKVKSVEVEVICRRTPKLGELLSNGLDESMPCYNFKVNGKDVGFHVQGHFYTKDKDRITLEKTGENSFTIPKTLVQFSNKRKGQTCVNMRIYLEGEYTSNHPKWKNYLDAFSLITYCSKEKIHFPNNRDIYNHRRVSTLNELNDQLGRPFEIILE